MNSNDRDPGSMVIPLHLSDSQSYTLSGKIMLAAIVIIFFFVILTVFLHLYARWNLRARSRSRNRNRRHTTVIFFDPSVAATAGACGLDPFVMKTLPVFVFSAAIHPGPIECAVCLSEFEENESGRVLPNCKHTFHVDCIDMWFHSHSTCPLCRSLVEPFTGLESPAAESEVVISIPDDPGSSSGMCATCQCSSDGAGTSAAEVTGIKPPAIKVPRRNPGEFEDEPTRGESRAINSFRSPKSRMLSFKRILSRERKTPTSPSGGAPSTSPKPTPTPSPSPSDCRTSETESDIERGRDETH